MWDGGVMKMEIEKQSMYQELAADLAVQNLGYRVTVIPVVFGVLSTIMNLSSNSKNQR